MSKVRSTYDKRRDYKELSQHIRCDSSDVALNNLTAQINIELRRLSDRLNELWQEVVHVSTPPTDGVLDLGHSVVLVDSDTNSTITLPAAALAKWKVYTIKRIAGAANLTIQPQSGELIDGATELVVLYLYSAPKITSDGSAWYII